MVALLCCVVLQRSWMTRSHTYKTLLFFNNGLVSLGDSCSRLVTVQCLLILEFVPRHVMLQCLSVT